MVCFARLDGADRAREEEPDMVDHVPIAHLDSNSRATGRGWCRPKERTFAFEETREPVPLVQVHTDEIGTALRLSQLNFGFHPTAETLV